METPHPRDARIDDLLRDIEQRESSVLNELWKLILARQARRPDELVPSETGRHPVTTAPGERQVVDRAEPP